MRRAVVLGIIAAAAPKRSEERSRVMKKVATLLVLLGVALLVTPCYAGKPATRVPLGVRVFDANDQFLGLFLGFQQGKCIAAEIFVPSLNHSILINLVEYAGQAGEVCINDVRPRYESSDCTGQAYFAFDELFLDIVGQKDATGTYRYYRVTLNELKTVTVLSVFAGTCYIQSETINAYDVIEIPKESIPFTFPVALPLRYEASSQ